MSACTAGSRRPADPARGRGSRRNARDGRAAEIAAAPRDERERTGEQEQPGGDVRDDEDAADQRQADRGAEVGLEQDEDAEDAHDEPERLQQRAHRSRRRPAGEQRARPDADGDLRDLGRLHADRPEEEPAARAVDRRCDDEHGDAERERTEEEHRSERPQSVVVEARGQHEQARPTRAYAPCLTRNVIGSPAPSAAEADVALNTITRPKATRPSVTRTRSRCSSCPSGRSFTRVSFCTSFPNSSPRCSKSWNWSKLAHAGESSTTSLRALRGADATAAGGRRSARTGRPAASSAAAISSVASPITKRTISRLEGLRQWPERLALPRPPRMTSFRAPGKDASARSAAATFVAFESFT